MRAHFKEYEQRTSWGAYLMMLMRFFFLIFFIKPYVISTNLNCLNKSIKAYIVVTHLNCLDLSRQFKWVPSTYAFIKEKKHGLQSEDYKLLDWIRLNTVPDQTGKAMSACTFLKADPVLCICKTSCRKNVISTKNYGYFSYFFWRGFQSAATFSCRN